jgi:hypothetical protein
MGTACSVSVCKSRVRSYGLDGRGSIPGRDMVFLFSMKSRPALGLTQPHILWMLGALSPEVKRLGSEADNSSPSSAGVKKGGAIPPLPFIFSWPGA